MAAFEQYHLSQIQRGRPLLKRSHAVYLHASYSADGTHSSRIIYKENKHHKAELTRYEMAFGEMARLFLPFDLTPPQRLVLDDSQRVVGLGCEHLIEMIRRREGEGASFYQLSPHDQRLTTTRQSEEADVPYYLLNQFPPGFFKTLLAASKRGEVVLDMKSLAGVLTTSYTLEEDDLHKANFGFYVVARAGKPTVVFYKIDHDLMMADSVMSHLQARFVNWFNGSDAFRITARDLLNFPRLIDSGNYYWPTTRRALSMSQNYAFSSTDEVHAFSDLALSPEFEQAKWLEFYKHILLTPELIVTSLEKHLNADDATDRARISLVTQSVVARQAKLRAVLFSLPEFRQVVSSLDNAQRAAMIQDITVRAAPEVRESISLALATTMECHQTLCRTAFQADDTPLHAAIRLGDYRYHETIPCFKEFLNKENRNHETPLDLVVAMAARQTLEEASDIRKNMPAIAKHLLESGAMKTAAFTNYQQRLGYDAKQYCLESPYTIAARQAPDLSTLKQVLSAIGRDHTFSLKMQKDLALMAVRGFIDEHRVQPGTGLKDSLRDLKEAVKTDPGLQYIRQLRSQLWIVRILRGLYGTTTTQSQLNQMIDLTLRSKPTVVARSNLFSAHHGATSPSSPPAEPPDALNQPKK